MNKLIIAIVVIGCAIIVATGAVLAQSGPGIDVTPDIMVVFYTTTTEEVVGYAPYNEKLVIDGYKIRSDTVNMDGVNWSAITYGFYQYQDIPKRYVNVDGVEVPDYWTLAELNLQPLSAEDLPHSQHIAQLTGVDVNRAKPIEVTRKFHGIDYTENCFVSQNVISLYQAGELAIGDYVIVSYISETPNYESYELPIVVDKVFKSWD